MKAIELVGDIDEQHRLRAQVPAEVPAGPVRLIVLVPDEDEAGVAWAQGVGKEWIEEFQDSRQDVYTLEDGQAVNAPRSDLLSAIPLRGRSRNETSTGLVIDSRGWPHP